MYNVKSLKAEEFISDEEIKETLEYAEANKNNIGLIDAIIEKAHLISYALHPVFHTVAALCCLISCADFIVVKLVFVTDIDR